MAKSEFSQEVREEYKQNVREIKIKGNLVLNEEGAGDNNMLSTAEFNGYTSDDLAFTTNSNKVRITGNTPTSGSSQYYYKVQITEENFATFNVKRASQYYKFKMKILNNVYNTSIKVSLLFKRYDDYEEIYELSSNWESFDLLTKRDTMNYYIPGSPEYVEIKGIEFYFMTPSGATHDVDLELELSFEEEDISKVTGTSLMPNYVGNKDLGNGVNVSINKDTFTFNGTSNASSSVSLLPQDYPLSSFILPAGNYIFKSVKQNGSYTITPTIYYKRNNEIIESMQCNFNTYTFKTDISITDIKAWFNSDSNYDSEMAITIFEDKEDNGVFVIGEGGTCEILDFRVDEKTDLYYETMPFSELSIDVDNTEGYFSDFTENSITDKLNKGCYIDFYLNVNNTGWCRAWTMQFDELTITTDKAKLTFKPYCLTHRDVKMLYDKNSQLVSGNNLDFPELNDYFEDNYHFSVLTDRDEEGGAFIPDLGELLHVRRPKLDLTRILMEMGTVLDVIQWGQILTISDNKAYKYRRWIGDGVTWITNDVLVEKPLIKKEEILGVRHVYDYYRGWLRGEYDYKKTIKGTLQSSHDNIILYDDDYKLESIATDYQNKITATGCTVVSCQATTNIVNIGIEGTEGTSYTINIDTQLDWKVHEEDKGEKTEDKENENYGFIIFTGSIRLGSYFEYLKQILRKKINMKIKALPYLQVGDVVRLEGEPSGTKIIITSIRTTWSSGFKMEIEGYEVEVPYYE